MKSLAVLLLLAASSTCLESQTFVCETNRTGAVKLTAESHYTPATPGFDLHTSPEVSAGACSSNKPFFFSIALPEGNYSVTV